MALLGCEPLLFRFGFFGACPFACWLSCSICSNVLSNAAIFLFSRSDMAGAVADDAACSPETCVDGVTSRLRGRLRPEPVVDGLSSSSRSRAVTPSLPARLFVACPVLSGEICCLPFLTFFAFATTFKESAGVEARL